MHLYNMHKLVSIFRNIMTVDKKRIDMKFNKHINTTGPSVLELYLHIIYWQPAGYSVYEQILLRFMNIKYA